jgi:hypothetical protein
MIEAWNIEIDHVKLKCCRSPWNTAFSASFRLVWFTLSNIFTGRREGGYIGCGYTSMAQCAQPASGLAAQCIINPYFAGAQRPAGPHSRRYRHEFSVCELIYPERRLRG